MSSYLLMVTMRFSQGFSSVDRIVTSACTDLMELIPILTLYPKIRCDLCRDQCLRDAGALRAGSLEVDKLMSKWYNPAVITVMAIWETNQNDNQQKSCDESQQTAQG